MRILIAEDDSALAGFVRQGLQGEVMRVRRMLRPLGGVPVAEGVRELVDREDALLILRRYLPSGHSAKQT